MRPVEKNSFYVCILNENNKKLGGGRQSIVKTLLWPFTARLTRVRKSKKRGKNATQTIGGGMKGFSVFSRRPDEVVRTKFSSRVFPERTRVVFHTAHLIFPPFAPFMPVRVCVRVSALTCRKDLVNACVL